MAPRKVPVTISYKHSASEPPIYLAGSFSDPAWQLLEMDYTKESDEYNFHKEVIVEEGGQFQYKFRIGGGDWWVLDENAPTVTDDIGNRNNLLTVPIMEDQQDTISEQQPHIMSPLARRPPIPELVVEKTDSDPCYGDDFGNDATTPQKHAHKMRAQDAEPDYVVVRSDTPDCANTAAEVADSAAFVDKEAPTPPISDEEAGRTGHRRLSMTPIPDVARVAAEVADSAAIIDSEEIKAAILPAIARINLFSNSSSGRSTPHNERAPLFAHECVSPYEGEEQEGYMDSPHEPRLSEYEIDEPIDTNDPLLEEFPSDRLSILEHVRSAESRLSADETQFSGIQTSPVIEAEEALLDLEEPPLVILEALPPPPLHKIVEEEQEPEREADNAIDVPKSTGTLSHGLNGDVLALDGNPDGSLVVSELPPGTTVKVDEEISDPSDALNLNEVDSGFDSPVAPAATLETGETPEPSNPKSLSDKIATSNHTQSVVEHPSSPANEALVDESTHFRNEGTSKIIDTATSTSIGSESPNGINKLMMRNVPGTFPGTDRPITPASLTSPIQDGDAKNFLEAIWQTVFLGWIGGLITRICGGKRRPLLAISAIVILFTIAPALYFSNMF